jgi:hypothetical protein
MACAIYLYTYIIYIYISEMGLGMAYASDIWPFDASNGKLMIHQWICGSFSGMFSNQTNNRA